MADDERVHTLKDAHYHQPPRKFTLKPQDTNTCLLEWLKFRGLTITRASEMWRDWSSYTTGGRVRWHRHSGRRRGKFCYIYTYHMLWPLHRHMTAQEKGTNYVPDKDLDTNMQSSFIWHHPKLETTEMTNGR